MAKRILILFLLVGATVGPGDLSSCVFFPETMFTPKLGPLDEGRFFSGKLGILQRQYQRIYLMAAYRYLVGMGLTQADQQALEAKPSGQASYPWMDQGSPAVAGWLQARVEVGAARLQQIDRFKMLPDRSYILNCGDDAFRNAAATLTERGRAGATHDDLRTWVAAQDQVFANCSAPQVPQVPGALPGGAAGWMQADRAYQIAAAEFYGGQFDAAAGDFLRIAADRASAWHKIAPYLAARALIRKATIDDGAAAAAAQEQLRKVLADPEAAAWHESARGLARYLLARTDPGRAFNELAHAVETGQSGIAGTMNDYRLMLDRYFNTGKQPPREEDITAWIATMQNSADDDALVKWRATRSLPWLVAALTYASRPDAASQPDAELMAAAAQVPQDSPAFQTVEFHRLRLLPAVEARPKLDALLRHRMAAPERNMFRAERMRLAEDWNDWLRYAPRTATGFYEEGSGEQADTKRMLYFDEDAARILNYEAPLALLERAARNSSLPQSLQLQVARAVWVRAILAGDAGAATRMTPELARLAPYLKPYLDGYLSAPDEKARAFAAVWLMLNNPGMEAAVYTGEGRTSSIPLLDSFRDNWWCPAEASRGPMNDALDLLYQGSFPAAGFLTAAERAQTREEQKRRASAGSAPTFLARQTVEWVEAHPDDPRAAEALRLAVRVGHYACGGDAGSDGWLERAFQRLHSRYPGSAAAKRTPYWFSVGAR